MVHSRYGTFTQTLPTARPLIKCSNAAGTSANGYTISTTGLNLPLSTKSASSRSLAALVCLRTRRYLKPLKALRQPMRIIKDTADPNDISPFSSDPEIEMNSPTLPGFNTWVAFSQAVVESGPLGAKSNTTSTLLSFNLSLQSCSL